MMSQPSGIFRLMVVCACLCIVVVAAVNDCPAGSMTMTTSIPIDLPTPDYAIQSTYESWLGMINKAQSSIDIACFYMTLTDGLQFPQGQGGYQGMDIYKAIITAAKDRGVAVRIVQQKPTPRMPDYDTGNLTMLGVAEVRSIDFINVNGYGKMGGILHTKLMVVDGTHAYVGSANMDWRALTQVKEVGVTVMDCPTYAQDVLKAFDQYWIGADSTSLPSWPSSIDTTFDNTHPMIVGNENAPVYVAVSPDTFAFGGRQSERMAIMRAITNAKSFVKFAVMDYSPTTWYSPMPQYWAEIDDYIRSAAFRGVNVQLMFSVWNNTNPSQLQYWRSLSDLKNVQVKAYQIPDSPFGPAAPFTRVSHSKYLVSDFQSYVTTSNCVGDYYLWTGGVSVNVESSSAGVSQSLKSMFESDWLSSFAGPIPDKVTRPRRSDQE